MAFKQFTEFRDLDGLVDEGMTQAMRRQEKGKALIGATCLDSDRLALSLADEDPKPHRRVKSADEISASVKRFCQKAEATL